jgi:hypothetical protein
MNRQAKRRAIARLLQGLGALIDADIYRTQQQLGDVLRRKREERRGQIMDGRLTDTRRDTGDGE